MQVKWICKLIEIKVQIDKPSWYVTIGMENILGVVVNDEAISGACKIRAKLINSTPLLSKKMLQIFWRGFFLHLGGFGL